MLPAGRNCVVAMRFGFERRILALELQRCRSWVRIGDRQAISGFERAAAGNTSVCGD